MKLPKIERLPSGSYRAQIQIDGKRHSITGSTQKEVEREVAALKLQLKQASAAPSSMTLKQAVDCYIAARQNVLSPATIRGYRNIQRNRFPQLMNRKVKDLTAAVCQSAVNAESKRYRAKTVSSGWGLIGSVIEDATGTRPKVRIGQVVPNERPFFDPVQIKQFLALIQGTDLEIPCLLALSSLRRSEIQGLQWESVDLKNKVLHISQSAVYDEYHNLVYKKETKNRSSNRTIPIIDPLYDALSSVEDRTGLVVKKSGNSISKRVNRLCEQNGFPHVGLHGLRHSFASLAYSLGTPEKIAMEIGGWANSQTMHRIYTHIAKSYRSHYESEFTSFFENAHENAHESQES